MTTIIHSFEEALEDKLARKRERGLLRTLSTRRGGVDFCSNDYLGMVRNTLIDSHNGATGATGSRLLSGNTVEAERLEKMLSDFHDSEAALLFNSGYDANLGVLSALPQRGDTIIYDALVHASMRDGIRLSLARSFGFAHNDLRSLREKLTRARGRIYIAVESLYSMDGDIAPLEELTTLAREFNAVLIVDEAHATGFFGDRGEGLVQALKLQSRVEIRVHTFGKALGAHGAVVLTSRSAREYLINTARSLIYSTALPPQSLSVVEKAYGVMSGLKNERSALRERIAHFRRMCQRERLSILSGETPIQGVVLPGAQRIRELSEQLWHRGFDARPIVSPTVSEGAERIRVCLHSYNTTDEISSFVEALAELIR